MCVCVCGGGGHCPFPQLRGPQIGVRPLVMFAFIFNRLLQSQIIFKVHIVVDEPISEMVGEAMRMLTRSNRSEQPNECWQIWSITKRGQTAWVTNVEILFSTVFLLTLKMLLISSVYFKTKIQYAIHSRLMILHIYLPASIRLF